MVDSLNGSEPQALAMKLAAQSNTSSDLAIENQTTASSEAIAKANLNERLKSLTHQAKVMLFMKGSPDAPRCGFSRQIVEILKGTGKAFETFDILTDDEVRQGLKTFSNWPTYPQLYVGGELQGGLDIVKEYLENDELADLLDGM